MADRNAPPRKSWRRGFRPAGSVSPAGSEIDRREFLSQGARVAAGTAIATTALAYSRILGANDRIALGHIGVGNRGRGLDRIVSQLKDGTTSR
jgi:hypothetical protein